MRSGAPGSGRLRSVMDEDWLQSKVPAVLALIKWGARTYVCPTTNQLTW